MQRLTPATLQRLTPQLRVMLGFALGTVVLHVALAGRYGYFRDELYYLACAQHLDFGYVDQPPLIAVIAWLSRHVTGDSLWSVRFPVALAAGGLVALAGLLAQELGGRTFAVALACLCTLIAPVYLGTDTFLSMNAFEPLFWMGAALVLLKIANGATPRLWVLFGAIVGLGLENKHSTVFFSVGLAAGILATPMRAALRERWIWLGALIAFALALPNVLWEVAHHWATWELLSNVAHSGKNVVLSPFEYVAQQLLLLHPLAAPVWIAGLVWLLRERRYRALGVAWLVTLAEFIVLEGKNYYLSPSYPMLFGAGAVWIEGVTADRTGVRAGALALLAAGGAALAPTILPILPPEKIPGYLAAIHVQPPRTETSHTAALPQHLADQFGWEEMARSVADAWAKLPDADRAKAGIFAQNYGEAAAIDFFGPRWGLPPALSGHQNYFLWGPRGYTGEVLLVMDDDDEDLQSLCASVEDAGPAGTSPFAMPWEQRQHLYVCRGLKTPLAELWPQLKHWL